MAPAGTMAVRRPRAAQASADRLLTITLTVSCAAHALVVGSQLVRALQRPQGLEEPPLRVVYESAPAQPPVAWTGEGQAEGGSRVMPIPPPSSAAGGGAPSSGSGWTSTGQGLPVLPAMGWGSATPQRVELPSTSGDIWASAADLTDLSAAADGNPVLLSYFSAIREHIQRVADAKEWVAKGTRANGTIYVGFVVLESGAIDSVMVMADRSAPSQALQAAALRIIRASDPFLPFPPSLGEASKAIVVPLEFGSR